jgi:aldose 1-epimerase
MPDGTAINLYTLCDGVIEVSVIPYGARLTSVKAPDRDGRLGEVVLGHETLEPYLSDRKNYLGAIVGRFANRIAAGRFTLDGETCQVPLNDGPNCLHGGPVGFDQKVWRAEESEGGVSFSLVSPDGEMGFPGTLTLAVRYRMAEPGRLLIEYTATTDGATVVNVTNHAYFNLAREASTSILDHELTLHAERFTPINETLIPTGELAPVSGTLFDFRTFRRIGERIDEEDAQLRRARGYDHNWVLDSVPGERGTLKLAARLKDPASGRVMAVETTEPGIQFYSGNFLDGTAPARDGKGVIGHRSGLCLETQGFPDAPNQPQFPSVVLRPGETLRSQTSFHFSVEA